VLLSRDLPCAAVDERTSCLDRPVPADFGDFPAQSGLSTCQYQYQFFVHQGVLSGVAEDWFSSYWFPPRDTGSQ